MDCTADTSFVDVDAPDQEPDEGAQLIIDDNLKFYQPETCGKDFKVAQSLQQNRLDSYSLKEESDINVNEFFEIVNEETEFKSEPNVTTIKEEFEEVNEDSETANEPLMIIKEEPIMDLKPEDFPSGENDYNEEETDLNPDNQVSTNDNNLFYDEKRSDANKIDEEILNSSSVAASPDFVTCLNCKRKYRQIYRHIRKWAHKECAQFYVLEDEKEKFNLSIKMSKSQLGSEKDKKSKLKRCQNQKDYVERCKEKNEEEYKAKRLEIWKKYRQKLKEEGRLEEMKAKNREASKKSRERLMKVNEEDFEAKNCQRIKREGKDRESNASNDMAKMKSSEELREEQLVYEEFKDKNEEKQPKQESGKTTENNVEEKETCRNCKKKLKHIYPHIMHDEACAQHYDLDDESKKYKAKKQEANKKYIQKIREEGREDEFRAKVKENRKKRLRKELGEEEFKARERTFYTEYRERLKKAENDFEQGDGGFKAKPVKVTCINCKKKYNYIYTHIRYKEDCAKFYDLDDEKRKYNSNEDLKANNKLAKQKYKQKVGEEVFKAKESLRNKENRRKYKEKLGDEEFKAKERQRYKEYRERLKAKECEKGEKRFKRERREVKSEMVSCLNCKKILKHIYIHIKSKEECAKFYDLDEEKKKYNSNEDVKANNNLAKKRYRKRLMEELSEEQKEELRAKKRARNKVCYERKRRQRLKEENEDEFQEDIEIKNEALEIDNYEAEIKTEHFEIIKEELES